MGDSTFESRALTTLAVLQAGSPEAARRAHEAATRLLPTGSSPESRALAMSLVLSAGEDDAAIALELATRIEPSAGTDESRVMVAQGVVMAGMDEARASWAYAFAREFFGYRFSYDAVAILMQAVLVAGDEDSAREAFRAAGLLEGEASTLESFALAARTAAAEGKDVTLPPVLPELSEP